MVILGCFGYIAASIPLTIYRGWALTVLWGWFIAPLFGLPPLTIPFGIGLSLVVGFLTAHYKGEELRDDEKEWWESALGALLHGLILPTFTLAVGWIVQMFI
jgi:hypothetical protein